MRHGVKHQSKVAAAASRGHISTELGGSIATPRTFQGRDLHFPRERGRLGDGRRPPALAVILDHLAGPRPAERMPKPARKTSEISR